MPPASTPLTVPIAVALKVILETDSLAVYRVGIARKLIRPKFRGDATRCRNQRQIFIPRFIRFSAVSTVLQQSVCQYNEDCPPDRLCDRLNRICINPCSTDTCGTNALCVPNHHAAECRCPPGSSGNPHISCTYGPGEPFHVRSVRISGISRL